MLPCVSSSGIKYCGKKHYIDSIAVVENGYLLRSVYTYPHRIEVLGIKDQDDGEVKMCYFIQLWSPEIKTSIQTRFIPL